LTAKAMCLMPITLGLSDFTFVLIVSSSRARAF
jgi:hypothetical protein